MNLEERRAYVKAYNFAHRERSRAWRLVHHEELRAKKKIYQKTHREVWWARHIKAQYGLTPSAFNKLLADQGGICAVCGNKDWNGRGPHVDHDHITGMVRGILCSNCNAALGQVKDSIPTLERMIEYLKHFLADIQIERAPEKSDWGKGMMG